MTMEICSGRQQGRILDLYPVISSRHRGDQEAGSRCRSLRIASADVLQVRRDEGHYGVLREPLPVHRAAQPVQEVCALGAGEARALPARGGRRQQGLPVRFGLEGYGTLASGCRVTALQSLASPTAIGSYKLITAGMDHRAPTRHPEARALFPCAAHLQSGLL